MRTPSPGWRKLDDCFYYSWDDQGRFSHSNIMTPRDDTGLVH